MRIPPSSVDSFSICVLLMLCSSWTWQWGSCYFPGQSGGVWCPLSSLISWRIVTCHPNTISHNILISHNTPTIQLGLQAIIIMIRISLNSIKLTHPHHYFTSRQSLSMSKILLLGASQSNNPILLTQPSRTSLSDYKVFDMRLYADF